MHEVFVVTLLLVFGRVGGLMMLLPGISTQGMPRHVPVLTALIISLVITPLVPSAEAHTSLGTLLLGMVGEIALGLAIGGVISVVFSALALASEIMSLQTGLAMATLFNPVTPTQTGPEGVMASLLAASVFMGAGLHGECLVLVSESFLVVPPGSATLPATAAPVLLAATGSLFSLGLQLAAPVLVLIWMINVFIAMSARLAPRMNVFFSMGMTLSSGLGLLMLAFSLPWVLAVHHSYVEGALAWAATLVVP